MMKKTLAVLLCAVMLAVPLVPQVWASEAAAAQAQTIWPGKTFETGAKPAWVHPLLLRMQYFFRTWASVGFWEDSFLIMHEGKIVYESYKRGYDVQKPHAMNSVTKSVVSALVGIAIKEGLIGSVQDKVSDYYPEAVIAAGQESKRDMTIEHLLTMSSGLPADGKFGSFECLNAKDSGLAAFETPQANAPGKEFLYSSGANMQCLAGILEKVTGRACWPMRRKNCLGRWG